VEPAEGARTFQVAGEAYDSFMGRYSGPLAHRFADAAGVAAGLDALDVGCGPGALTSVLVERLGAAHVRAVDPSPPFVEACRARHPGVDVRLGRAEEIPLADATVDLALAQLVLPFVSDPAAAAAEMRRVLRPGGVAGASAWDLDGGMRMLRLFWDAARAVDPASPGEGDRGRFGRPGELRALFVEAGLEDVQEHVLTTETTYRDLDELWSGLLAGIGSAGSHLVGLPPEHQLAIRAEMDLLLGRPQGPFTLTAAARCALGRTPR